MSDSFASPSSTLDPRARARQPLVFGGLPEAEGWGGAAFEKMVRSAAERTLTRLAGELPQGIGAALPEAAR